MTEKSKSSGATSWLLAFVALAMLVTCAFMVVRITLFLLTEGLWYERLISGALLFAESFLLVNCVGYFANVWRVLVRGWEEFALPDSLPELEEYPPIAIVVASYREPLEVVESNLICFRNLTYPNKQIYLLDDTRYELAKENAAQLQQYRAAIDELCRRIGVNLFRRRWHGAKAGMINDFLAFIEGRPPEGWEFHQFQKTGRPGSEKYIAVFDADMNPLPDFAESIVQIMEENEKVAFVQTPQYYSNFESNRVARAAGLQQVIFYEYICEGKSLQDAMFCCGTNVMFRRKALVEVGGFDESSVTEDFATSIKFHSTGWSSVYLNRICAFGMGPQDLGGHFKQQFRWALGTTGLIVPILRQFLRSPGSLSPNKWCEYLLSSTYYFVGWTFLVLLVCPVIYLFFNIPRYFAYPNIFFIFFVPYFLMTALAFMNTLRARSYRLRDIYNGLLLTNVTFPIYMQASLLGLLGVRGKFGITPKSGGSSLPLGSLWPQLLAMTALLAAAVWGLNRVYYVREPVLALLVNIFWCLYNFWLLSTVFYFNRPEEIQPESSVSAAAS
jgi:cellulose synthase/poly-beta-1,6-N-acetylglucosamine synthase-like glycosyltransferase